MRRIGLREIAIHGKGTDVEDGVDVWRRLVCGLWESNRADTTVWLLYCRIHKSNGSVTFYSRIDKTKN